MGIKTKFWKINGNPYRITWKGALVIVGAFVAGVLVIAGIINLFV